MIGRLNYSVGKRGSCDFQAEASLKRGEIIRRRLPNIHGVKSVARRCDADRLNTRPLFQPDRIGRIDRHRESRLSPAILRSDGANKREIRRTVPLPPPHDHAKTPPRVQINIEPCESLDRPRTRTVPLSATTAPTPISRLLLFSATRDISQVGHCV